MNQAPITTDGFVKVFDVNNSCTDKYLSNAVAKKKVAQMLAQVQDQCQNFKNWHAQADFDFGFILISEFMMPENIELVGAGFASPFDQFIIIGDRQARESLINKFPTQLLGNSISPTGTVNNLGVTFDSGNTFTSHITNMCRSCYYHLKDLRHIRKFLIVDTVALLANSMISSPLDYCNSLLYGISKYNVAKLQKIKNPFVELFLDLIELAMSLPFFRNYTGSLSHTASSLSTI